MSFSIQNPQLGYELGLALAGIYFIISLLWLMLLRKYWVERLGLAGYAILVVVFLGMLGPPLGWCLALLPSINNLANPLITGIGGAPYGLEYGLYPWAVTYSFLNFGIFAVLATLIFRERRFRVEPGKVRLLLNGIRKGLSHYKVMEWGLFAVALLLVIMFFTYNGWSRLIESNVARWSRAADGTADFLSPIMKIVATLTMFVGMAGALFVAMSRRWALATLATVIVSLPLIVMASRGYSLVFTLLYFAFAMRVERMGRRVMLLVSPVVIFILLMLPLRQRYVPYTGLKSLEAASSDLFVNHLYAEAETYYAVKALANVSNGFPILVEIMDRNSTQPIASTLPMGYIWRSFAPTISLLDHFSTDWLHYTIMLNPFTPINAVAELYGISPYLAPFFMAFIYIILLLMVRRLQRYGALGMLASLFLIGMAVFSFTRLQQYPLRTTMRVIYTAFFVGMAADIYLSRFHHSPVLPGFRMRRSRKERLAGHESGETERLADL